MKKVLIVNGKIDWIDRSDIKTDDIVICFNPEGIRHFCLWNKDGYWFIMCADGRKGKRIMPPSSINNFIDIFEGDNKDFFKGWKFYKLVSDK